MSFQKYIAPNIGRDNHDLRCQWVINELKALAPNTKLLDAGAGTQQFKQYCSHLEYVSQDFAQYLPSNTKDGLHNSSWEYGKLDIISDIVNIPCEDASFDAILCSEVLEHLPHPNMAIKEFGRLLKPRGILLLTAPFCSLTHQAPYFHSTGFSVHYYQHLLEEFGFTDIEAKANGSYFKYLAQEVHRLNGISKKYTIKKQGLNLYQKLISYLFLRVLKKQSSRDTNSEELLCYGYFVKCSKKLLTNQSS